MAAESVSPEASAPDPRDPRAGAGLDLIRTVNVRSAALTGIFLILALGAISLARTLLLPLALALIAQFALSPAVRQLRRVGVPDAVGAVLVLGLGLLGVATAFSLGAEPAREWLARAPGNLADLRVQLLQVREPIEDVVEATEGVATIAGSTDEKPAIVVREGTLFDGIVTQTGNLVVAAAVVLVLLYFLLASGDAFLRKVVLSLRTFSDKRRAVEILRNIESDISRYLLTVTLINLSLGCALALALWAMGMPQAPLWGALGAVANFVPFLGPAAMALVLALAAATALPDLWHVGGVVGVWVLMTSVEGFVITPSVLGRRMTLSPFAVLVSILLWSWLWGVPGAFVAVPTLVVAKVVLDAVPAFRPLGLLMERDVA